MPYRPTYPTDFPKYKIRVSLADGPLWLSLVDGRLRTVNVLLFSPFPNSGLFDGISYQTTEILNLPFGGVHKYDKVVLSERVGGGGGERKSARQRRCGQRAARRGIPRFTTVCRGVRYRGTPRRGAIRADPIRRSIVRGVVPCPSRFLPLRVVILFVTACLPALRLLTAETRGSSQRVH